MKELVDLQKSTVKKLLKLLKGDLSDKVSEIESLRKLLATVTCIIVDR